jgi:hypothetical protein
MSDPDTERVDPATLAAEEDEAQIHAGADRPPTEDEERAAEGNELDPDVARAYQEANERGADVKGEGQIEP